MKKGSLVLTDPNSDINYNIEGSPTPSATIINWSVEMNNLWGGVGYWTDTVPEDTGTIFASFDSASGSFNVTGTSLTIYAWGKYGPHNDWTGMDTPYYSKNGGALTPFGNTYSTRTTIPIAAGDIITITATGWD